MSRIHPLACVDGKAQIADDAEVGPYCVIGPDVEIGAGCRLVSQVNVTGRTTIGPRTIVYPFASLGTPPQSTGYRGEATRLIIGAACDIREGVTMNIGTAQSKGVTVVGDNGFFMANAHVGHDCTVGANAIFANCATLGGHCDVGAHVFIGGLAAVHQNSRVGDHAMISGVTGVRSDVIPFGLAIGAIGRLGGLNVIGMRRRGMSKDTIATVRNAYRGLFFGSGVFATRVEEVAERFGSEPAVAKILNFIRAGGRRALCNPGDHRQD